MGSPATRSAIAPRSATNRSRVTNGRGLFVEAIDGRSREARRFRDVVAEIVSDLGGPDTLSEGQRQLARRAAMLSVQCEVMEGNAVAGKAIDLETFGKLTDRLGRTFQRLGLRRKQRDVTPNLRDYLKQRAISDGGPS
jgi:hypothetical protein